MANHQPQRFDPPGAPVRPTMAAVTVYGGIAYLSGVIAADDDGNLIGADDPAAQAKACVDGVERILAAAGATLDDVLRATCFATTADAAMAYIRERSSRMTNRPAATTVLVSELLLPGAMLEVEVIARIPG